MLTTNNKNITAKGRYFYRTRTEKESVNCFCFAFVYQELAMSFEESATKTATLLPWDRFQQWMHCVCVVTFDLELGQAMEVKYCYTSLRRPPRAFVRELRDLSIAATLPMK